MIRGRFKACAIVMVLASIQFSVPAVAQDTTIKTKKQAEILVPRISREAVQSMDLNRADRKSTRLNSSHKH